jgi:putative hemolysin
VVEGGGALIIFPAGEVAHQRRPDGSYADSPWVPTTGRLVRATGAQVLPTFITGRNTKWFYAAGRIHPALRTVLLARELLKKRGHQVILRLGDPMAARTFADADVRGATDLIRRAVDDLRRPDFSQAAPAVDRPRFSTTDSIAAEVARRPSAPVSWKAARFRSSVHQPDRSRRP